MQINITARHLDLTKAISDYVRRKVERCERYFEHTVRGQVILTVEKYRQVAEIVIHGAKTMYTAKAESIDLYAAIDLAGEKLEKQLKKRKEMSKDNRKANAEVASAKKSPRARNAVIPTLEGPNAGPAITEIKRFDVKPVSVEEAISEMELLGYSFYMFLNEGTSQINVIYRRENNTFGLLQPEM